jgi:hypothetical protein
MTGIERNEVLHFQGNVKLSQDRSSVELWDVRHQPFVVAKVACAVIRDAVERPTISEEDCHLLALRNIEVLTEAAQMLFSRGRFSERENGFQVIDITLADLKPHSRRISTSVLETAQHSGWVGPANER